MRIKNWNKFQHFKDRTPPWVKLYRELLDDPDWHELDEKSSKVLVMLWLIASEDENHEGMLPDVRKLAFRMRISESSLKQSLTKLSHWLIQDDINVISDRYQSDAPETETETETEVGLNVSQVDDVIGLMVADGVSDDIANEYIKHKKSVKAKLTVRGWKLISGEIKKSGMLMDEALEYAMGKGWKGFEASWVNGKSISTENKSSGWSSAIC